MPLLPLDDCHSEIRPLSEERWASGQAMLKWTNQDHLYIYLLCTGHLDPINAEEKRPALKISIIDWGRKYRMEQCPVSSMLTWFLIHFLEHGLQHNREKRPAQ